jgi:hypothetical protein
MYIVSATATTTPPPPPPPQYRYGSVVHTLTSGLKITSSLCEMAYLKQSSQRQMWIPSPLLPLNTSGIECCIPFPTNCVPSKPAVVEAVSECATHRRMRSDAIRSEQKYLGNQKLVGLGWQLDQHCQARDGRACMHHGCDVGNAECRKCNDITIAWR